MNASSCFVGVDTGIVLTRDTSGVCRVDEHSCIAARTSFDRLSRLAALGLADDGTRPIEVLAVDAPVIPAPWAFRKRLVESVFASGRFARRCKPGFSHVGGTGRALARAGAETVWQFHAHLNEEAVPNFPRALSRWPVIEAFPNAFLGVQLGEDVFERIPPDLPRGGKSDWLLERWIEAQGHRAYQEVVDGPAATLFDRLEVEEDHDMRAALVCALTAASVGAGRYTAVGDERDGWFFLPPWERWSAWARKALVDVRERLGGADVVDVQIDGIPVDRLPG